MFQEPGRTLKKADGTEIMKVGDIVSYSMRSIGTGHDIAAFVDRDIWRTSQILIARGGESFKIHNTLYSYRFVRSKKGFAIVCGNAQHELDAGSNLIAEELLAECAKLDAQLKSVRR